ncbi:coproporphyrinogen III oxidase [Brevibacillus centrosporus]|uniref:Oxygen-independent coproporphyrinogen-3 oxidase n=1 Tax=Brevibacillus centrosporus TaxID=54910 RepID=A0A1I3WMT6_9BACL|nr:coproporphyrinogen III oxidase [Brevibacillus centrosporus]MEC2131076.1 coproporphyrinogen III oxidase [Brevibacillus centrosporus]RNB72930.1 coproporphyrinogen III oxidase [Brevibacillus centrosporus]GED32312.1 oxygen-independent coproporphyrinogen-III oxidase-like protein HemZ [Brevibacillus centrosporus]SFK08187.1 oxygen-independent coproporphyrinogen-3 oxidase [Brevibacillus centrosporus]
MIQITCVGHAFERELSLILALFYEDPQLSFVSEWTDESDLKLKLALTVKEDGVVACGELFDGARRIEHQVNRSYVSLEEKAMRKTAKQALCYALLLMLEEYTGMEQGWGILTGIRPTKLLHQMNVAGIGREEAHKRLQEEVILRPYKLSLLQDIVDRQLQVVPDLYQIDQELSVYIGIPFCPTKCAYCTFPAYAIRSHTASVNPFLEGLHYEIEQLGKWLAKNDQRITSIYFGGGTPTSITAEDMDQLFDTMYRSLPHMDGVRELTVEAGRPDTITREKLDVMKRWEVDRISINPQSFTQETLNAIGRHHTVEETIEKYHLAMEMGLTNINMDLIIGLPNEGVAELAHSLREVEKLMPASLTVHTLSFKRASEMTQNKERYKVASRDEISKMMEMASEWTAANGYDPYYLYRQKNILGNLENVGYSKPGQESIYNIMIMEEVQTILGLGCGAVSKLMAPGSGKLTRWPNPKDPKTYNDTYRTLVENKLRDLDDIYSGNPVSVKR